MILACAAALVSCGGGPDLGPDRSAAAGLLSWSDCDGLECATLTVPLDHGDPTAGTTEVAVARRRAPAADRLGVLLVNPGGPGGSGTAYARALVTRAPELAERFDLVGWDPRGVSGVDELACDAQLRTFYLLDNEPDDAAEADALVDAAADATAACAADGDDQLPHLGTDAVVEDLELLRQALGEDQISYFGASYGTSIGLVYLERHPDRVRAVVLDGVLDPTLDLEAWLTSQAVATEAALERSLGADIGVFDDVMARAEAGELSAGRAVGPSDVARAAIASSYRVDGAAQLRPAMISARDGDAAALAALSDQYLSGSAFDVYTAVSCVDNVGPGSVEAYAAMADRLSEVAPRLGAAIANELLPCATWPVPPNPPLDAASAGSSVADGGSGGPTVLVLGNTGDAATPYADAVAVTERLDDAVLVTWNGSGHTSYGEVACVNDAVHAYLFELTTPPPDTVC